MWKCHKCGKPVYFAERKQSLGYDWHPECLRCEECGKRLNPGQHAEHKGVPYCHVPCYGALFGPQLFGHGTRVESHTSFGKVENKSCGPNMPRSHLESKLRVFNQFYDGRSGEIRSREVNGRLVLEGALRIHWGVLGVIHLMEDDDQRVVVRKRNSVRKSYCNGSNKCHMESEDTEDSGVACSLTSTERSEAEEELTRERAGDEGVILRANSAAANPAKFCTLPSKLGQIDWDELDDLLQVERCVDENEKLYQTMPVSLPSITPTTISPSPTPTLVAEPEPTYAESHCGLQGEEHGVGLEAEEVSMAHALEHDTYSRYFEHRIEERPTMDRSISNPEYFHTSLELSSDEEDLKLSSEGSEIMVRRRLGSVAIKRRPGKRVSRQARLKRRCSINGHFYNRETSFFTPPFGSQMSVWVTSLVSTHEVVNLMLDKYKVDASPHNFALFVVRDNGEQRRLLEEEYPLMVRVMLGPHEDVAKLYLMDRQSAQEVSCEVAQFLNLSGAECSAILQRYTLEEEREARRIRAKYREIRRRLKQRMEELKVRL